MLHRTQLKWLTITLSLGVAGGMSCVRKGWRANENNCFNQSGDEFCAERYPDGSRPYCYLISDACTDRPPEEDGCVVQAPPPECHAPCGGDVHTSIADECPDDDSSGSTSSGPTATTDDPTMGPGPETTTGSETETTDDPGCEINDDCMDADAPFCADDGMCVPCDAIPESDTACSELDPTAPVCSDGQCVQCTDDNPAACDGQTPGCNTDDNLCVACTEHAQCPDSACHLDGADVGGCFDEGDVVMASNTAQLESAFTAASADDDVVVQLTGTNYANVSVDFVANAEVAVLGDGSQDISGNTSGGIIGTGSSAIVYFAGVSVAGNISGDGINCSGTSIWLDDTEVRNNAQVGLDVSGGCAAHLRRTVVRANAGGGVETSGATSLLAMENSLVVDNVGATAGPGVRVTSAEIAVSYSVLAGNGTIANPDNIECLSGATGYARNSIVSGQNGNSIVTCGGLTWENNGVDTSALGGSNENVGMYDSSWFADPGTGDYRLTTAGESEFMNIAQWQDGDPLTDIDGEPIPTDMPSFPGYHQP